VDVVQLRRGDADDSIFVFTLGVYLQFPEFVLILLQLDYQPLLLRDLVDLASRRLVDILQGSCRVEIVVLVQRVEPNRHPSCIDLGRQNVIFLQRRLPGPRAFANAPDDSRAILTVPVLSVCAVPPGRGCRCPRAIHML
jgi:hypothetical protein